jgi:hypothetical protein
LTGWWRKKRRKARIKKFSSFFISRSVKILQELRIFAASLKEGLSSCEMAP